MHKDPNLHFMQISIPQSIYGECTYIIPKVFVEWFAQQDIKNWGYSSSESWGDGYTNGLSNKTSTYMVYNIHPEDATLFKIFFPTVRVYTGKQYDYSKIEANTGTKSRS